MLDIIELCPLLAASSDMSITGVVLKVAEGVLTAGCGYLAGVFCQRFLYPLYTERFTESTKLAEEYQGVLDFGHGPNHRISLRLEKLGFNIKGTLKFIDGPNKDKAYKLIGRYANGLLTFSYKAVDRNSTSQGTATFKRLQDGDLFSGAFAYYSQLEDKVASVMCDLAKF